MVVMTNGDRLSFQKHMIRNKDFMDGSWVCLQRRLRAMVVGFLKQRPPAAALSPPLPGDRLVPVVPVLPAMWWSAVGAVEVVL
jgi:hypothetical protein